MTHQSDTDHSDRTSRGDARVLIVSVICAVVVVVLSTAAQDVGKAGLGGSTSFIADVN